MIHDEVATQTNPPGPETQLKTGWREEHMSPNCCQCKLGWNMSIRMEGGKYMDAIKKGRRREGEETGEESAERKWTRAKCNCTNDDVEY